MRKPRGKRKNLVPSLLVFLCFSLFLLSSCSETQNSGSNPDKAPGSAEKRTSKSQDSFTVLNSFPHDPTAFTQGLVYRDGFLYESTGLYGKSSLRKTNPATGKVLAKTDLPREFFGEGLTIIGESIYQLTWKSGQGFIYGRENLKHKGSFAYSMEGWGLTDDGTQLIMSDGTEKLYFLSPESFEVAKVLRVKENGAPVPRLNELEYVDGKIYCNIWHSDDIVVVDPESGMVEKRIKLGQLREKLSLVNEAGVLNGIAWKSSSGTFLITGKNWSEVFEIKVGSASP
ncbi:MAG: glutaminyl-peptide cyclotransferase [Candidatus Dadabacteria bacterium]|nr:glutaminyl-peptide cyclotransferase [Candidatus Dadabacteria bacterium]